MDIKLTNSLSRTKQKFVPIEKNKVSLYSCGPTVYNYVHLGNLRAWVFSDILKRMFVLNGYKVKHIINITDVGHLTDDADEGEDKLEKGAKREGKTVWEVAKFFEEAFKRDIEEMNIIEADKYPRATKHIKEMIELNKKLEANGYTYVAGGNLYFDTSKFPDYWRLIGKEQDAGKQKTRVGKDLNKKNHFDFVLWFTNYKYESHEMEWDSPWGRGFPGWHLECSAMSTKYLGEKFDIHTGGIDHVSIHHTNEIAQNNCSFGHSVVNYWMHNEFLVVKNSEKMSKSGGNFLTLESIKKKGYSPLDYRYLLLGTHYRKKIMFSFEALDSAKNAMTKLKNRVIDLKKEKNTLNLVAFDKYKKELIQNVNDDLNTSKVLASLWDFIQNEKISSKTKMELVKEYDKVLGLELSKVGEEEVPEEVLKLKKKRDKARQQKDFKKSDEIRDILTKKGYRIFDGKSNSELKKI